MSFAYNKFKNLLGAGSVNMGTADFRVALLMTDTTADIEPSKNFEDEFTDLDECNGASYARVDLASVTLTRDDPNDLSFLDADDAVFTNLGAGTRQNQAAWVYIHVTDATDSIPAFFIDQGGFPFDGTGSNNTIQWNVAGIAQVT
jgi:hypothetical protein